MRYSNMHGFYELNPMPGCNQLVVSNHAFIYPAHRGKGHGNRQHKERLLKISELGYDAAICTVNACNAAEMHILNTHGWRRVGQFVNKETGNTICIFMVALAELMLGDGQ